MHLARGSWHSISGHLIQKNHALSEVQQTCIIQVLQGCDSVMQCCRGQKKAAKEVKDPNAAPKGKTFPSPFGLDRHHIRMKVNLLSCCPVQCVQVRQLVCKCGSWCATAMSEKFESPAEANSLGCSVQGLVVFSKALAFR